MIRNRDIPLLQKVLPIMQLAREAEELRGSATQDFGLMQALQNNMLTGARCWDIMLALESKEC